MAKIGTAAKRMGVSRIAALGDGLDAACPYFASTVTLVTMQPGSHPGCLFGTTFNISVRKRFGVTKEDECPMMAKPRVLGCQDRSRMSVSAKRATAHLLITAQCGWWNHDNRQSPESSRWVVVMLS